MTQDDFTTALEEQLRDRNISFGADEVRDYVETIWPEAQEEPDAAFWAERFLSSGHGTASV